MITLKDRVFSAIGGLCGDVIYGTPGDFISPERIVWRESRNRRYAQADGREHLAELNYTLDIFARSAEAASELFARADERMAQAGFRRHLFFGNHAINSVTHKNHLFKKILFQL